MNLIQKANNYPLVSVVMPAYNGEDYIFEAIQSILQQSYSNLELIIVDDGSTDKTAEIVNTFSDKRITFIKKPKNSGIADSLNVGILNAKGMYFARMDDDDVSNKDRLLKQVEYLEANKDVVVCATNDQNLGGNRPYLTNQELKIGLFFRNVIIHASVMMPMAVFKQQKYNPQMVPSEDYDLWSRICNLGKFHKLSEPLMQIRYATDGQTATRRHEQLQLNTAICKRYRENCGFYLNQDEEYLINRFIEYDYSINAHTLIKVLNCLNKLKLKNLELGVFPDAPFKSEIEFYKYNFIIKYFVNLKFSKKIHPFIKLPFAYKLKVINYYFKKFF